MRIITLYEKLLPNRTVLNFSVRPLIDLLHHM